MCPYLLLQRLCLAFLFFLGTMIAGIGFGPTFTGSFRSIMDRAPKDQRAGLASTVYIISYLSISLPVILVGIVTTKVGLRSASLVYILSAAGLYVLALLLSRFDTHGGGIARPEGSS